MNLTCYIIDDEPHAVEILSDYIGKTPGLQLLGTAQKPLKGLEEVSHLRPAVIFLDVDMPEINGLALAELLGSQSIIVFTTAFSEYAVEAFNKEAADYLLKPISYYRFLKSIQKTHGRFSINPSNSTSSSVFIKTGIKGKMLQIDTGDISFVSAALNYVEIHLINQKIITYLTIEEVLGKLPSADFSRIHRSYIVKHDSIVFLEFNQVRLKDSTILPVGRAFQENFRNKLKSSFLISRRDHID